MAVVAIVTPIYATEQNRRLELFDQTIRSVLRQSHPNFVYITVDDGSTVDVGYFLKQYQDSRLRYVKLGNSPSGTPSIPLNKGLDLIIENPADILVEPEKRNLAAVGFLHSDDLLPRDSLRSRLSDLSNGFLQTPMAFFRESDGIFRVDQYTGLNAKYYEVVGNIFNHHTTLWSPSFLLFMKRFVEDRYSQIGIFDPKIEFGEDKDMSYSATEAAKAGNFNVGYSPTVSVLYRSHGKSMTAERRDSQYLMTQRDMTSLKHFGMTEAEMKPIIKKILHGRILSAKPQNNAGDLEILIRELSQAA